jgi:hypothetical protein
MPELPEADGPKYKFHNDLQKLVSSACPQSEIQFLLTLTLTSEIITLFDFWCDWCD